MPIKGGGGLPISYPKPTWTLTESYSDPLIRTASGGSGRTRMWTSGSDSTGQLVRVGGMGTTASPFFGFVFGWCGGTGAAIAAYNQIRIRIPRGGFNWMRIKSVHLDTANGAGCDFTPLVGIATGEGNTYAQPLGEMKISTQTTDDMVWDCDYVFRIDTGIVNSVADSMSNLVPLTGTDPHPCISIWTAGYASVASLAFFFMVQVEWVEL